jgi:acetyl esterase
MPLHPFLEKMLAQPGRPQISAGSPSDARAVVAASRTALGKGPDLASVTEVQIPTRSGSVPGRLFLPTEKPLGVVVYLHGGGWVAGALDDFDTLARHIAHRSECALVLVDYRLAPEFPFPAGLEDAEDSLRWANGLWSHYSTTRLPLIVGGDSAGANLAIVAANTLRSEIEVALLALVYPVTDAPLRTKSYESYGSNFPLTSSDMIWFFNHYANESLWLDPRITPLQEKSWSGSPPVWIATAEYDVLRDEGEMFAQRLQEEGISVKLRRYEGVTHGFIRMMNLLDTADTAVSDLALAIKSACQNDHNQ